MRKLTSFTFFKDTPLIDFQNTILFNSNIQRDNFFLNGGHYQTIDLENIDFNFIRDRSELNVSINYNEFRGVNYCTFLSDFEPNTRYYAYVITYEYNNDNNIRIDLLIDPIMTFCQGSTLESLTNLSVTRKHMYKSEYNSRLWELKNNGDVLKTSTKTYFKENEYLFKDFDVIIQCSCDLTADFGTVDNPLIETSEGITFDNISSPVNLYQIEQVRLRDFMKAVAKFPWITQNIKSINLIPSIFINNDNLESVTMTSSKFNGLSQFKDKGKSSRSIFENALSEINYSLDDLYEMFNLDDNTRHLLRSEYTTSEVYTWDSQQLLIDNGLLNESAGIKFKSLVVTGYSNEVALYLQDYKRHSQAGSQGKGSFLNDAIYFRNFDDIPILIDNYTLALSKSANQRELAESQLITNRIKNVADNSADIKDRFYDAASILTNFSPMNFFGKFVDEHNFYQRQQAEFADLSLSSPTITTQNTDNALKRSENYYGVTIKFSKPSLSELNKLKRYYKMFGFEVNDENSRISVRTQTICDYVKFSGSWTIPNVDVALIEQMKAQFENGVRFWHNNDSANPMDQDVMNNVMR